jgi:two-component system chemotaxis response regulator CheY
MPTKMDNLNILLAEDDSHVRMTIRSMLLEMSIRSIKEVADGQEALHELESSDKPDLIICDWNMPHKTGMDVLKETRSLYPDLPFLMVTARADTGSVMSAKEALVTAYIRKPFSFDAFQSKISKIFDE